jgi:hypothetical protein
VAAGEREGIKRKSEDVREGIKSGGRVTEERERGERREKEERRG